MICILVSNLIQLLSSTFLMFGYVSNLNSFPQPRTPKEEKEILKRHEEGCEEARNVLIERNLRLVAHIVKKYCNSGNDTEDLISIGTIGLIKGISTFDQKKGTRLATYAARCIENEILMHIRSSKKIQNEISLQEPIGVDKEGNEITLIDLICNDGEAIIDEVDFKIQVKNLYEKMKSVLQKREKLILELRYGLLNGNTKTQREIAKMLRISRSYVSRIEKKAIKKLGKEINVEGCN